MGVPVPEQCLGKSLVSKRDHPKKSRVVACEDFRHGWFVLRQSQYALVVENASGVTNENKKRHWLLDTYETPVYEAPSYRLYDIKKDPAEERDLAQRKPRVFQKMKSLADAHFEFVGQVQDPAPSPEDASKDVSEETKQNLEALGYL